MSRVRGPGVAMATALTLAASGCGRERERPNDEPPCPTWRGAVAALVAERCATAGCHTGDAPAGDYRMDDYLGTISRATAGDAGSALLAVLAPGDATHAALAGERATLAPWVVECRLDYGATPLHPGGLMNPADPGFHGAELAASGWDFEACRRCHGDPAVADDWSGGAAGAACTDCHAGGPTACTTCHDAPPATGSHAAHALAGPLLRPTECAECHVVPARWDAPGHILAAGGGVDPAPAEVVLGALAARDLVPPRRTAPPAWDPVARRCDGVYCHGGILDDAAAAASAPVWGQVGAAACGGCHGTPPASHAAGLGAEDCATCHPAAHDAGGALDLARHLDGAVQLGEPAASCTACHGDALAGDPAPPRALDGSQASTALGVGAHRAHLVGGTLRGPLACSECHLVPDAVVAPGHLDSALPAEVFAPGSGVLARAGGAVPVWDRASATCSGSYCHGAATPVWTRVDFGEAACGTCHGIPPESAAHAPDLTLTDCAGCHATSVSPSGGILVPGPHLDGVVDVQP